MYDALTSTWSFSCPARGGARVALSAFRQLERLPGATHPAVYRVRFDCGCGDEHLGLLSHDDLDWAPLGAGTGTFVNLMTSRSEHAGSELVDVPFWNDARIGVVEHVFGRDALYTLDEFRSELYSSRFDERRLDLS